MVVITATMNDLTRCNMDRYLENAIKCLENAKEDSEDGIMCKLSISTIDMVIDLLKERRMIVTKCR